MIPNDSTTSDVSEVGSATSSSCSPVGRESCSMIAIGRQRRSDSRDLDGKSFPESEDL